MQVSPMIMKVACFFSQHSPMLGQPASSQTVTRPFSRTIRCVSAHLGEPGALTRIQSGFRARGWSGRCAFSGCRGRLSLDRRSRTTAIAILTFAPSQSLLLGSADCEPTSQELSCPHWPGRRWFSRHQSELALMTLHWSVCPQALPPSVQPPGSFAWTRLSSQVNWSEPPPPNGESLLAATTLPLCLRGARQSDEPSGSLN